MLDQTVTLDDLRRILRVRAGAEQDVDLDGDILDIEFDELGYDSLALLETAASISREYGVRIDDDGLVGATTPRRLLELLNAG
jgi:minimal PKS acyl carrier protein